MSGAPALLVAGSCQITMRLDDVAEHNGEKCAKIFEDLQVTGEMFDDDDDKVIVEMRAQGYTYRSLLSYLDVEEELKGRAEFVKLGAKTSISGPLRIYSTAKLK